MRRQTQSGVVVESIDHLLIVVYEWTRGDWYTHVSACVCVFVYMYIYIYCLIGDNGRLQYLKEKSKVFKYAK